MECEWWFLIKRECRCSIVLSVSERERLCSVLQDEWSVRDEDEGAMRIVGNDALQYLFLSLGIERRGGFVEDEDAPVREECTRYGDALCLTFG